MKLATVVTTHGDKQKGCEWTAYRHIEELHPHGAFHLAVSLLKSTPLLASTMEPVRAPTDLELAIRRITREAFQGD